MTTNPTITAHGTLAENGDTFFVIIQNDFLLIDTDFLIEDELLGKTVSVIGKMGFPASAPGIKKLLTERIVLHESIAIRAFEIFESRAEGSPDDHWLRAERELLGLPPAG
jgi:Protein of unknown function (DUF2934)